MLCAADERPSPRSVENVIHVSPGIHVWVGCARGVGKVGRATFSNHSIEENGEEKSAGAYAGVSCKGYGRRQATDACYFFVLPSFFPASTRVFAIQCL